jgi:hypothetical protein
VPLLQRCEGKSVHKRELHFGSLPLTLQLPFTPRPLRLALGGGCYHVINRGNGRAVVFRNEADFLAFERVLPLAFERISVRLLAWCFGLITTATLLAGCCGFGGADV